MRPALSIALAAALLAAPAFAAPDVLAQASRANKGILVLQVGSDWCVSGEDVRRAFESDAFRRAVGSKFVLAVHDEKERMDDQTKAANKLVAPALVKTKRFPALTLVTPHPFRFYAQIENIPRNVTGEKLAAAVKMLTKRKDEAEALFKKGASLAAAHKDSEAADAYGEAFDILERQVGDFNAAQLRKGPLAYAPEWKALSDLDAGDRFGWVKHFELDAYKAVALVEKLTGAKSGGSGDAKGMVQRMKEVPDGHFSPNQRQFVKVLEYALTADGTNKPLSPHEKSLMKEAFAMGRDTFWGQFAMGRLMMDGEKIESKGLKKAEVRQRPSTSSPASAPAFVLDKTKLVLTGLKPGAKLSEKQKLAAARYAVLRLVGQKGWHELTSRPGSSQFVKAFMSDREWLEDFAWSGTFASGKAEPGDGAKAVLALESLIYQDNGKWVPFTGGRFEDNEGRRFMTALALVYPEKDEAWLADVLDAYRTTALAGRLHKTAYAQPVWLWRFAVNHGRGSSGTDNMAAQQRHLDKFVNLPSRAYGGTCWMISYRLKNCFGDSVHGPYYYKAWATAGEWPKRRYSQIVGGVCGELSKFGSATANAHGLPSTTAGQPGHCAYTRRLVDGRWEVNYSVTGHSQMHMCFWNRHEWQYSAVIESTFSADRERRLSAERMLALAALAEESGRDAKTVEMYYQYACAAHVENFDAWTAYGDWLARSGMTLDKQRVWVRGCARALKSGRQPVWNFLTPYFARVAKEKGAKALAADLVAFAPNLRQCNTKIQEESDFRKALETWTKPIERDPQLCYDVLKAMLDAQYGTPNYFSQTLGWGSDLFMKSSDGLHTFVKCIGEVMQERKAGGDKPTLDFKPLILGASRSGNLEAFRQMADLQARISPEKLKGERYAKNDFGGTLLSDEGLLRTSTTSNWDTPARYAYVIDSSPPQGNGFHTEKEKSPWAEVILPGPSSVTGLVIENRCGGYNATRQVPLYVDVSEDGTSWQRVSTQDQVRDTYRIDLRKAAPRARHVRVGRVAGAKEEVFHLGKIVVYGKKLY